MNDHGKHLSKLEFITLFTLLLFFCHYNLYIWRLRQLFILIHCTYHNFFELVDTFLDPFDTSKSINVYLNNTPFAFTCWTCFYILASFAFANLTTSAALMRYFHHLTIIHLLQSNLKCFLCWLNFWHLSFSRLTTSPASEEHV